MSYLSDASDLGLLGERLCLDFTNTAGSHPPLPHKEFLRGYVQLVDWGKYVSLLSPDEAHHLLEIAVEHPAEAQQVTEQAIHLREVIHRILSAIADDREPDNADMEKLHEALVRGLPEMRLRPEHNSDLTGHNDEQGQGNAQPPQFGYGWVWSGSPDDLARLLWPVVWDAADLLQSEALQHIRICAGEGCDWLFLDTSRNGSRRWCSMKSCGNRAKARSHYQRGRKETPD